MRSVENKLLTVPLGSGANESAGKRSATPALYRVQNARVRSSGSLQKRCGTLAIAGTTDTPAGTRHALTDNSLRPAGEHPMFTSMVSSVPLAGTDAGDAFVYSDAGDEWKYQGSFSTCTPAGAQAVLTSPQFPPDGGVAATIPACALNAAGYLCYVAAYTDSTVRIVVLNPEGEQIAAETVALGGTSLRVEVVNTQITNQSPVAVTDGFVVLFSYSTTITTRLVGITGGRAYIFSDGKTFTISGAVTWDAARYDATTWVIAYATSATDTVVSKLAETTETVLATNTDSAENVSVYGDSLNGLVWVGYRTTPFATAQARYSTYEIASGSPAGPFTIDATATGSSPPLFGPIYGTGSPTTDIVMMVYSALTASAVGSLPNSRYTYVGSARKDGSVTVNGYLAHVIPVSKPFTRQRLWVATALEAADAQGTLEPMRFMLLRVPDISIGVTTSLQVTPIELATPQLVNYAGYSPASDASRSFQAVGDDGLGNQAMALGIAVTSETYAGTTQTPLLQAQVYRYSLGGHRQVTQTGDGVELSGQPSLVTIISRRTAEDDSAGIVETGFVQAPAILSLTTTAAAGSVAAGTYAYKAELDWVDELGRRVQSAPSQPVSITLDVAGSVTVLVAWPRGIGCRVGPEPVVRLFRTTAGGELYQQMPLSGTLEASNEGCYTFTDTLADASIAAEAFIYTDGGVLPNQLAPSCIFTASGEDRLWCGGLWDPTILEASKVRVPGEPLNFTGDPTHQVVLPEACTGIAYMDGQLVAFSENSIYLVGGDGPNDQGAGTFLPPRMLTRGIGCVDYRSVLETPIGVLFQSKVGIYLLPRGFGAPQYIGMPIQDTISTYTQVLSSAFTVSDEYNLARFLIGDSDDVYSPRLVTLDIDSGQWFIDEYSPTGTADDVVFRSFSEIGAWPDGLALFRYTLSDEASPIWSEDESVYSDAGADEVGNSTVVQLSVQTTWIYPFGIGGWGKVNKSVLSMDSSYPDGIETGTASITLAFEIDSEGTTLTDTWSFASGSASDTGPYRGYDHARQRLTCIRGTITNNSASRGPKLIGLTLEIEPDGGIRMLTDTERS